MIQNKLQGLSPELLTAEICHKIQKISLAISSGDSPKTKIKTKKMTNHPQTADKANFYFIGWKFHKSIKKKAMDQKFSGARGLLLSLSIAFFIVLTTAYSLSFFYKTVEENRFIENFNDNKIELTKN